MANFVVSNIGVLEEIKTGREKLFVRPIVPAPSNAGRQRA